MTLQEILKAKNLSDEDIESVIGEMKQNKIFTTSHENMDVRYPKLKTDHDSLVTQHGESSRLIEQLKADAKGNEALQAKISSYESAIAQLQQQLKSAQAEAWKRRRTLLLWIVFRYEKVREPPLGFCNSAFGSFENKAFSRWRMACIRSNSPYESSNHPFTEGVFCL